MGVNVETDTEQVVEPSPPKQWKNISIYNTYEEASLHKTGLLSEYGEGTLVKIRRCGEGGTKFKVKLWYPELAPPKKKKKNKTTK